MSSNQSSTQLSTQPGICEEPPWKRIALFLLTLAVLVVVALLLQPFFTAIVGAIVMAVIAQRPYNWLASKIARPSTCAAVAVLLVVLAIIVPSFFLGRVLVARPSPPSAPCATNPPSKRSPASSPTTRPSPTPSRPSHPPSTPAAPPRPPPPTSAAGSPAF